MMAFPQPYFHGIHIKATWDGEINHAVDLDISLNIDAVPNSRLRLISLEAASHADMTGINENSPATTYTGGASNFHTEEAQEMEAGKDRETPNAITDLSLDTPSLVNCISRIPLPKSRGSSPQKSPLPVAQRPPWRSAAFENATKPRGRSSRIDRSKSRVSNIADGSCSPTKLVGEKFGSLDPTRRGRELLRDEIPTRASCHAMSGHRTTEGTPEQKVTEWLDHKDQAPTTAAPDIRDYNTENHGDEESRGTPSVIDNAEEHDNLLPSPTPSSQAMVPWTSSVRYRNPLRLRGAGSCPASFKRINGCLYAVFPVDVTQVVHRVQIRASVSLRKDSDKGGHLLEIPGFPTQDETEGCFTLLILDDHASDSPTCMKIAHVDSDFGINLLTGPRFDMNFSVDAPFSLRLLRFEEGVQELTETDFEIDYDIRTSSNGHLIVCSFRLRDFVIWADYLRAKVYISGGPFDVLGTVSVKGAHQVPVIDQYKNCREREVTMTMKAAEVTETFAFVCEGRPGTLQFWAPRVSRSRLLAQDVRAKREVYEDLHETVLDASHPRELEVSEMVSIYQLAGDTPVPKEGSGQAVQSSEIGETAAGLRSLGRIITALVMAYLVAYYVVTQFPPVRDSLEESKPRIVESVYHWSDLAAAKMSERFPGYNIGVEEEIHEHVEEDSEKQLEKTPQLVKEDLEEQGETLQPVEEDSEQQEEETPQPVEENVDGGSVDEDKDDAAAHKPAMRELTLRDKIDRALGWKGPFGDERDGLCE